MKEVEKEPPKRPEFRRLKRLYIFALTAIPLSIIFSEVLVQSYLNRQLNDSHIINLAGRQRMLSQKLTKELLLLRRDSLLPAREYRISKIQETLGRWQRTQQGLIGGDVALGLPGNNTEEVREIYVQIGQPFLRMEQSTYQILNQLEEDPEIAYSGLSAWIDTVLEYEPLFLEGMDRIVFLYDQEAREKIAWLKRLEIILLFFALTIIAFEIFFIFIPTTRKVGKVVDSLVRSEEEAKKSAEEVSGLYRTLQQTHKELQDAGYALDQATVFAKADRQGHINYVSEKFTDLTGYRKESLKTHISSFVRSAIHSEDFLSRAFDVVKSGQIWHDQVKIISAKESVLWLDMTIVPVLNTRGELLQLIVVGSDITDKKNAEEHYRRLDQERFEQQIREQRMKSSLILEGQEEERRRISKDIHDGIGQLLTGLKFQLESVNMDEPQKAKQKISALKVLVKDIILEVRRISFYLTPGVLEDYGLASAVNNFVVNTRKYTNAQLEFLNLTGFDKRLEQRKEINLYRIVQEAVNNAIKYSEADKITISFSHEAGRLTILIQDNGKGFDPEEVWVKESGSRGQGLYNMQERSIYADGKIRILSRSDAGTKVQLQIPID